MQKERNNYIDILRGIAMLMVVLGHTITGCTTGYENSFLYNVIWSLQMPLFVLISGYITRYSKKIETCQELFKFIKRRTVAYLLPWVVWTVLVRGIIFQQHGFLNIKNLLWHMDNGYWFLFTIWTISMIYGVTQFLSSKIVKETAALKSRKCFTCAEAGIYLLGMLMLLGVGVLLGFGFLCVKLTLYYMPFYFAGSLFGKYQNDLLKMKNGKKILDIVVAINLAVYLFIIVRVNVYTASGIQIVYRICASLTGCIALAGLESAFGTYNDLCSCGKITSALHWCGVHSLEIYLAHYLMLSLFRPMELPVMVTLEGLLTVLLNYAVTVTLTVLVIRVADNSWALRWILFGKKAGSK